MTMGTIEARLKAMGYELPPPFPKVEDPAEGTRSALDQILGNPAQ